MSAHQILHFEPHISSIHSLNWQKKSNRQDTVNKGLIHAKDKVARWPHLTKSAGPIHLVQVPECNCYIAPESISKVSTSQHEISFTPPAQLLIDKLLFCEN